MAIHYLFSEDFACERRFTLPRRENGDLVGYRLDFKNRTIGFFSCDAEEGRKVVISRWTAPDGARSMKFLEKSGCDDFPLGAPVFYDRLGNLLKIGNR
jgi:hypothetical protein